MKPLEHLAIIMDGNGRWAKARGHNRIYGHIRGAKVAKRIIEECAELKIPHLTLFTFSTENWSRPEEEVTFLMHLLARHLRREVETLLKNNIQFHSIGELDRLPGFVQKIVKETEAATAHCTGMKLIFALSYGGKQDLTGAVQRLAKKVEAGELKADELTEDHLCSELSTAQWPNPDLIIRTSGELRLSNFYLWQAAYSELYVTDCLWPDFEERDLLLALKSYTSRERRFGKTAEQVNPLEHPRN